MLFNDGRWSEADPGETVSELLLDLERPADQKALQDFKNRSHLNRAEIRPLSFYGDGNSFHLVRLKLAPTALGAGDRYSRIYLCYIKGPGFARHLDGNSTVMHQTNALKLSGNDKPLIQLTTDERIIDYLKFFCTFTTGEEGPFLILDHVDDLAFGLDGELRQGNTFEQMCAVRARDTGWPEPLLELSEADLKAWRDAPEDKAREFEERAARELQQSIEPVDLARVNLEQPRVTEKSFDPETKQRNGVFAVASLWYGPAIFNARFRIYANGSIEMLEDRPIAPLNISSWRFLSPSGILVREDHVSRADITAAEFKEQFITGRQPDQALHVANLLIDGDVGLGGLEFGGPVTFENVMIDGEFDLTACRFAKGLRLDRVEVTGRLMASKLNARFVTSRRLRIGGLFEIRGSVADDSDGHPPFGADFARAQVDDEFVLPGTEVNGGFNLSGIKVKGVADLSNLKVEPRLSSSYLAKEEMGQLTPVDDVRGVASYDAGLHARGAVFNEGLRLRYGQRGASEPEIQIRGGVDLYNAAITGELDLAGLRTGLVNSQLPDLDPRTADAKDLAPAFNPKTKKVVSQVPESASANMCLNSVVVTSNINAAGGAPRTVIRGNVDGNYSRIDGRVIFDGALIGAEKEDTQPRAARVASETGAIEFAHAKIGEFSMIWAVKPNAPLIRPRCRSLTFRNAKVDGALTVMAADVAGDFEASHASFANGVRLCGSSIGGRLDLGGSFIGQMLDGDSYESIGRTVVTGPITLSGATITSDARFCGASIKGGLTAITGDFARMQFRALCWKKGGSGQIIPMESGPIMLSQLRAHSLDLFGCQIEGNLSVIGGEFAEDVSICRSDASVYLFYDFDESLAAKARADTVETNSIVTRVSGKTQLAHAKVGGDISLSGLDCGKELELKAVSVGRTIKACSIDGFEEAAPRKYHVVCDRFEAEDLDVNGHVDFGGIDARNGLRARFGSFGAELTILDIEPSTRGKKKSEPSVDLFGTKGDRLKIGCGAAAAGRIDLQGAEFTQITVCNPDKVSLNPKGLQVSRWAFTDEDGRSLSNEGQRLFELLKRSDFDQGVYSEAERWLRRRGNENAADRLHISGRAQAGRRRRRNYSWWTKPLRAPVDAVVDLFHRVMTGYWTRSWPLMFIWTLLFLPSVLLASNPSNIAPSAIQLSEQETRAVRDIRPEAEDWSALDVIRVVASNHVPIIPLVAEPRWEYHDQAPVEVRLPDMADRYMPLEANQVEISAPGFLTPAFYGFWVRVFSWIALPVFLISTAASIQRRYNL